jgi:enamine deaminase RidA (YjgF/YER057c/UK114 family)
MSTPVRLSNPESLGTPLGSYSHVARAGDLVIIAGQVGSDASSGGDIPDDLHSQVKNTFDNLAKALESEGLTMANVMKFTTYLTSADDISGFYEARNVLFPDLFPTGEHPANTLLVVSRLVMPELKVEIEAIAHA